MPESRHLLPRRGGQNGAPNTDRRVNRAAGSLFTFNIEGALTMWYDRKFTTIVEVDRVAERVRKAFMDLDSINKFEPS